MATLSTILSPASASYPLNPNVAYSNSWVQVSNDQNRALFAMATYEVNGMNGGTYFSGASAYVGNWYAIQMLADTTFTTLSSTNWNGAVISNSDTFSNGTVIYGNFTKVTINSGRAIGYNF